MDNEWILKRILFWDDIIPEEIRFYVNYEYLNKFLFSYYFHHPLWMEYKWNSLKIGS